MKCGSLHCGFYQPPGPTWGLGDTRAAAHPPGSGLCWCTSLTEQSERGRRNPSAEQLPLGVLGLYDCLDGAADPAAQRRAVIGGGPLFQVKTHASENAEAGGDMACCARHRDRKISFRRRHGQEPVGGEQRADPGCRWRQPRRQGRLFRAAKCSHFHEWPLIVVN